MERRFCAVVTDSPAPACTGSNLFDKHFAYPILSA